MPAANATAASADLLRQLQLVTTSEGLTADEAERRLLAQMSRRARIRTTFRELARATATPLNLILMVAAVAAASLGEAADATIIATIVVLSIALDYWQAFRSERAMRQLQAKLAPTATIRRDGGWMEIERRRLVPGDVIHLSAGDPVPADARLLQTTDLHAQQSALTGESMPAEKRAHSEALPCGGPQSEGLVPRDIGAQRHGHGGRVCDGRRDGARRNHRRPGRAARRDRLRARHGPVLDAHPENGAVLRAVRARRERFDRADAFQSLLFSVALAVGLTPELLPMITTVTLAQGALRMARERVIVKHLPAIQNLGSIDVLRTDKTGTLTVGAMSVAASLDGLGNARSRPLELAYLNSHFQTGIRSPLDEAITKRCAGMNADGGGLRKAEKFPSTSSLAGCRSSWPMPRDSGSSRTARPKVCWLPGSAR